MKEIWLNWLNQHFTTNDFFIWARESDKQPLIKNGKIIGIGPASKWTLARIPLSVVFMILWSISNYWINVMGGCVLIVTALTDLIDGKVARAKNGRWKTAAGEIFDPVADKIFGFVCMVTLTANGTLKIALGDRTDYVCNFLLLILGRELILLLWRQTIPKSRRKEIKTIFWGKVHTWLLGTAMASAVLVEIGLIGNVLTIAEIISIGAKFDLIALAFFGQLVFLISWLGLMLTTVITILAIPAKYSYLRKEVEKEDSE